VQIVEGSYTEPVTLEGGVMRYLRSPQEVELTEERNPLLERLNLNIGVKSGSPLILQNNLAKAAIHTDLRVRGTAQQTGLTGRVNVEEGGELYLQERKYLVDRGVITFTNDRRIEPSLDILARTRAANYDITLQVQGDAATKIETTLTSDPPLPEPDIIAILVTGRTLQEARGQEVEIAKEQVLSHLTGSVGGALSRQLEQSTGLSQVRIEPSLIAAETQPTARLTLGQDLSRKLHLIYSMNLRDSNDQIWVGQYDITKRFSTQMVKQSDNSYRMEFRHDLQFGGSPDPNRSPQDYRTKKIIGDVNVTGHTYFTNKQILDRLKIKTGKEYDFFKVRKGLDRLQSAYAGQNLREARVRLGRKEEGSKVDLDVRVNPGPKVQFIYEGWDPSRGSRKRVEEAWQAGVFDQQRTRRATQIIQEELVEAGYLRAEVQNSITNPDEQNKRVLFEIHPGTRYRNVELVFEGARGIAPPDLQDAIKKEKLEVQVYSDPGKVTDFLRRYYGEQGYLDASVEKPRYELQPDLATGKTVIPLQEGFRYRVGRINFTGNSAYSAAELQQGIPLKPGENYTPDLREQSYIAIQNLYYNKGFADVELQYQQDKNPDQGVIDLTYQIVENRQRLLTGVEVAGTDHVSENLIRSQIGMKTGEPVSSTQLSKARRNLYNTNAFSLVDIEVQPVASEGVNLQLNQAPVRLLTKVREVRPFEIRYGAFYDTDRGPGGIADVSNRNMLGSARVIGLRTRYDSDLHEARLYFGQPLLLRFPLKTTVSSFARRELMDTFFTDRVGASIEEEYRFAHHYIVSFGYRFESAHTRDREPDPLLPFDIRLRIAPLTSSLTRETRDELLDATRGSFSSHAFEYAPSLLGSQIRYVRYYGQYFRYFPLSDPQRVPWANKMKTRFVYAAGVRVGLAHGLGGQDLIPSERFFAGGGTTIRGFQQNRVGPLDALRDPRGGDAVFILNNEIRAPLFHILDGVGFVDIGNVYRHLGDFNPTDVRKSAGLGIRARTPYFLLRLDYGVKLDRRTGERFGQLFFSIGQAF